ncbi:MAG: 30S ribosomal protein S3 [Candidatus Paceibacterota bacterium]
MTHTSHPYSHRLGILRGWKSRWFSRGKDQYRGFLKGDVLIRHYLEKKLRGNYVSAIEMERNNESLKIIIKTSRPGILIGRQGEGTVRLKKDVTRFMKKKGIDVKSFKIEIEEVRYPDTNASLVAQMIAESLEKRFPFRRVLKQTMEKVMANKEVKGARFMIGGRLGGADMSRKESLKQGMIPLQTFRADIDFARERAILPYGTIGIKVWINKGEVFEESKKRE